MNPIAPRLYGLPKLHKDTIPIRPVVSFVQSPSYNLAKFCNEFLKTTSKFKSKHGIINTLELVNKIKDVHIPPNAKIVSFDVKSLFTSIPVKECLEEVEVLLYKSKVDPVTIIELMGAIDVCVKQNYFQFQNKMYAQIEGLAMGSPLSPLLAEIFMAAFEDHLFKSKNQFQFCKKIIYWYRYVDDVICLFDGSERQLQLFFNYLNSINKAIQFTMDISQQNIISYLDLNIKIVNGKHNFSIFRKPTFTDNVIHANSQHPVNHKLAAFHSMLHRLINIPMSSEDYFKELNCIKEIGINNGYDDMLIDKLLNKKFKNIAKKHIFPSEYNKPTKWRKVGYVGQISYKLGKLVEKKKSCKPAFYVDNNLGKLLINSKDKIPKMSKCGVYQLSCKICNATYIGQTGRNFKTRLSEHDRSWRLGHEDSSFANHLKTHNVSEFHSNINFDVLHIANKSKKLNLLENLEINRLVKNKNVLVLNEQLELSNSPLLKPLTRSSHCTPSPPHPSSPFLI